MKDSDKNKRISLIIKEKHISATKFAKEISFNQSNLSKILRCERKVPDELEIKILQRYQDINKVWLLTGEGSMLKETAQADYINELAIYFRTNKIKQVEIANRLGIAKSQVNSLLKGRDKFGEKMAQRWEDEFGLNKFWLRYGEGSMLKETSQADNNATFVAPYITDELVYLPLITTSAVASFDENLHHATNEIDTYPVYVAKGETFDINKHVVIDVSGDSMYPTINDKAKVLCEKVKPEQWENIPNEKVVAVIYGSSFIIKRLLKNNLAINNSLTLLADNRKYGETTLQRCEIRAIFRVIKKVSEEVF